MTNGESLFSYKARTTKTSSPKSQPHNRAKTPTPKSPAKPHNRAKTPTPLNKSQKWLKDNPPNRTGIVDELKSMVDPKNLTGANAITAAIKGDGKSKTERVTTGLSGVVQGLGFAAGAKSGKPAVEGVKNTGIPARIANKVKGDIVVVHGTGRPVVGDVIHPRAGSAYSPLEPVAFAWDTRFAKGKTGGQDWIHNNVQEYSNRSYYDPKLGKEVQGEGNIVIGKVKKKNLTSERNGSNGVIASKKPIKITKVIKEEANAGSVLKQRENFIKELKKAGVKTKSSPVKSMLDKVEQQKLLNRQRKANKNSPV